MTYYEKYIKYKKKYLNFKYQQNGGSVACVNDRVFKNVLGTCWMIAAQTILCFGDLTKDAFQKKMLEIIILPNNKLKENINNLLIQKAQSNKILVEILPSDIFSKKYIKNLLNILEHIVKRYQNKVFNISSGRNEKNKFIGNEYNNTKRCELIIAKNYMESLGNHTNFNFKRTNYVYGGYIIDQYLFSNLLSIFFLGHQISFKNYYSYYVGIFNNISFNPKNDIGVLICTQKHVLCFFICDGVEKYYDDTNKQIFDFKWIDLLKKINNEKCLYIYQNNYPILLNYEDYINHEDKTKLNKITTYIVVSKITLRKYSNVDVEINLILNKKYENVNDRELNYYLIIMNDMNIEYLTKAASQGNKYCALYLGNYYYKNNNINKAIRYLKIAVEQHDDVAAYELGNIYENYNRILALKYYQLSASLGNIDALKILADRVKNPESIYKLGYIYENGSGGIDKDIHKAINYYKNAYSKNHTESIYRLGYIYENGLGGIDKDINKAINYYEKASSKNHIESIYRLGYIYENGSGGIDKDINKAINYYEKALSIL